MSTIKLVPYAVNEQPWLQGDSVKLQILDNQTSRAAVGRSVKLLAAHDVRGLRAEVVTARFPAPNARSVPLDYFPHVELRPADLPWRYAKPGETLPEPWLMLIVCPAEAVQIGRTPKGLMTLTWASAPTLPDPADRAFWAHVQLDGAGEPERARLLCPIRLRPDTLYVAALVPATLGGAQAALEQAVTATGEEVWNPTNEGLVLPAFDLWRFRTTDVSLEEVARRLKAFDGEGGGGAGLGQRPLQVRWPAMPDKADVESGFTYSGALVEALPPLEPAPNASKRLYPPTAPSALDDEEELGPAISPIRYGAPWTDQSVWSDTVNLNPGMRAAAGLGRALVVEHQEELVAAAWDKLAEARQVNLALGRAELAEFAVVGTFRQRVGGLTEDKAASLGLRARGLLVSSNKSVHRRLTESAVPAGLEDPALVRRVLRGGVASGRRVGRPTVSGVASAGSRAILGETIAKALNNTEASSSIQFVGGAFTAWAKAPLKGGPFSRMSRRVEGGDGEGLTSRRWSLELDNPLALWLIARHGAEPLVPGLDALPDDRVLMLNVNDAFIEALMVGANQALLEELIWRDVPARLGDAPLRRFWGNKADINPLSEWKKDDALGVHAAEGAAGTAVILRSRLISLIPGLRLRLVRLDGTKLMFKEPIWTLPLGGDTLAAGFQQSEDELKGYAFVLEQPPTDPRFGQDTDPEKVGQVVTSSSVSRHIDKIKQLPLRVLYSTKTLFGG